MTHAPELGEAPPGAWPPARRAVRRLARPVEEFLRTEAAAGIVLLGATIAALAWANSAWSEHYHHFWETEIVLGAGGLRWAWPLRHWIDDGLMTLFFFVVGLEIRREIDRGELSDRRRAALPFAAALGGMIVPAAIYVALNAGGPHGAGWGVPMATDIAFAVGVLTVLGKRVPPALRILLLSLAVIDDVGAILVIGLFYSTGFQLAGLAVAAGGAAGIVVMQRIGVRRPLLYAVPGLFVWAGCLEGGIHPTMAGVVVGLLTPARAWLSGSSFVGLARRAVADAGRADDAGATERVVHDLDVLKTAASEAVAPVDRLQHALHPWVAFGVMPLFAFANAGVSLGTLDLEQVPWRLVLGIALGLVIGKPLGIAAGAFLAVRSGLAALPRGVGWTGVAVVGAAGGIGFTMSLFVAELAIAAGPALDVARLSILVASTVAACAGAVLGLVTLRRAEGGAESDTDAESSTET